MLPFVNSHYLFIISHPICAPGTDKSALAAVSYFITDAAYNIVAKMQQLRCTRPDYILPSPNYLYSQQIDPYSTDKGDSELDFYTKLEKLLLTPNLKIFTWSVRNLSIIESIAYRTLQDQNLLDSISNITDINKVLKVHEIFDTGECSKSDNLIVCAQKYGFVSNKDESDYINRLNALMHLVKHLEQVNPQLLRYTLSDRANKISEVKDAISKGNCLVNYSTKHHELEILKPIICNDVYIKANYFDGGSVTEKYYSFNNANLFAPVKVLTEKRQKLINIDVASILSLLNNATADNNFAPFSLLINRNKAYTPSDIQFFNQCQTMNKFVIDEAPLNCSHDFRQYILKFRGNNFKKTLIDTELNQYYKICINEIRKQSRIYSSELNSLISIDDGKNEKTVKIINSLVSYINDL